MLRESRYAGKSSTTRWERVNGVFLWSDCFCCSLTLLAENENEYGSNSIWIHRRLSPLWPALYHFDSYSHTISLLCSVLPLFFLLAHPSLSPSSSFSGDKTRMDQLSKSDDCYVRASPTRGVLGGIAEHTADVITLCEAGVCVRGGRGEERECVCVCGIYRRESVWERICEG